MRPLLLLPLLGSLLLFGLAAPAGAPPLPALGSADDQLLALGRAIPGFGGLFLDDSGTANVYLRDPARERGALEKALGGDVRVRRGDHTFEQLLRWRADLRPLLALPGVILLDADEARNRVVIEIDATSPRKALQRDLLERGLAASAVPRPAVVVVESAPSRELLGLRNKVRPAPGGVEIVFPINPPQFGVCTIGFNATRGKVAGFVVNSHCTRVRGEVDWIRYSQSSPTDGLIGTEIADPGYSTEPPCPAGRRCRFSDAAFAKYDKAKLGALGKIARPTFGGGDLGSLSLIPPAARFTITGKGASPLVGEMAHKVGRTTGWTFGQVTSTCIDVIPSGTDITLFCQSRVTAGVAGGDSGSPVFARHGSGNNVALVGILWGGSVDASGNSRFVFSPLDNVEQELGALKVN